MSRINGPAAELSKLLGTIAGANPAARIGGAGAPAQSVGSPPQRGSDSVSSSERRGQSLSVRRLDHAQFAKRAAALDELGEVLESLDAAIKSASSEARAADGASSDVQATLDTIAQTIARAEGLARQAGLPEFEFGGAGAGVQASVIDVPPFLSGGPAIGTPGVDLTFTGPQVRNLNTSARLQPGQVFNADLFVVNSAQQAGFVLSFGGNNLNLGGPGSFDGAFREFRVEVTGALGTREFSFSSGTSLQSVVNSINGFSGITGVQASLSGSSRVRLSSPDYGSDNFVSVRVLDAGGAQGGGIYRLRERNARQADPAQVTAFAAATGVLTDAGQDVQLGNLPPGSTYTADGTRVRGRLLGPSGAAVKFDFDLLAGTPSGVSADRLGFFRAFTLRARAASPAEGPIETPAPADPSGDVFREARESLGALREARRRAFDDLRQQFSLLPGSLSGAAAEDAGEARLLAEQARRSRLGGGSI